MTPDRAKRSAIRWILAAAALAAGAVAYRLALAFGWTSVDAFKGVDTAPAMACVFVSLHYVWWRQGWLDRERQKDT